MASGIGTVEVGISVRVGLAVGVGEYFIVGVLDGAKVFVVCARDVPDTGTLEGDGTGVNVFIDGLGRITCGVLVLKTGNVLVEIVFSILLAGVFSENNPRPLTPPKFKTLRTRAITPRNAATPRKRLPDFIFS
ncbi:MAG: hypothetical protein GY755_14765 [Chloroflexi bacterium]|nr:hypothetical protein [Chloroflexota bacterium]